jgi:hypothetical protein
MVIHALEDLDDALAATRALLLPVDRSRWARLAAVVLFLGTTGANLNALQFNVPAGPTDPPANGFTVPGPTPEQLAAVVVVVALVVVVGLLFLLVGSIMEFVFVESLRREEVAVRRYWSAHWRKGLRLFGFRLVLGALVVGSVAVLAALFVLPAVLGDGPGGPSAVALVLLLPVFLVLAVVVGLVDGFTTVFVVPVMLLEGCGVLAGWRRLWATIPPNPWQYVAYAVAGFVLSIVGGILAGIAVAIGVLLLLIPFGVLAAVGVLLLGSVQPLGVGLLLVVGVLFGLTVVAIAALAQVPVVTYLRYYALLVLGDIEESLDLIPERRAAIREGGSEPVEG